MFEEEWWIKYIHSQSWNNFTVAYLQQVYLWAINVQSTLHKVVNVPVKPSLAWACSWGFHEHLRSWKVHEHAHEALTSTCAWSCHAHYHFIELCPLAAILDFAGGARAPPSPLGWYWNQFEPVWMILRHFQCIEPKISIIFLTFSGSFLNKFVL